jgi:hypothetical protein
LLHPLSAAKGAGATIIGLEMRENTDETDQIEDKNTRMGIDDSHGADDHAGHGRGIIDLFR